MSIDLHSHYIPVDEIANAGAPVEVRRSEQGFLLSLAGADLVSGNRPVSDFDALISDTVSARLDRRVISVPPFCFQYEIPVDQGIRWARALNDGLARAVDRSPQTLLGFATVPLQDPAAAATELDRARNELSLVGVEIASNVNGIDLDDPALYPFWEAAESLQAPILIHPHYVVGIERMGEYHARNLIGNPLETSLAAARLMFGGVLHRYPGLKFILSHGGGALPFLIGRLQQGYQVREECRTHDAPSPAEQLRNFYFDTVVFNPAALRFVVDQVSASQVVIGTDYPFDMSDRDPLKTLSNAGVSNEECAEIVEAGRALAGVS